MQKILSDLLRPVRCAIIPDSVGEMLPGFRHLYQFVNAVTGGVGGGALGAPRQSSRSATGPDPAGTKSCREEKGAVALAGFVARSGPPRAFEPRGSNFDPL